MEQVIKGFLGTFFLLLLTFLVYGFTSASITARNADEFMAEVVEDMRDSNCSNAVISNAKSDASELGYDLEINIHSTKSAKKFGDATLKYEYKLPILGLTEEKYINASIN